MSLVAEAIPLLLLAEAAGPRALPASAGLILWCYRVFKGPRVETRIRHAAGRTPAGRFAACHRLSITYR
jgi:hypothetical protein